MSNKSIEKPAANGWALVPFLVFAAFYAGLSVWAGDFYKVPMPLAFLLASAVAIAFGRRNLNARIETYAAGMGEVKFVRKGGFSRPSEPCVWKGGLYIANYGGTTLAELPLAR